MNQSKKYGIKNPKWICFLKPLFAQTCQRTTMMWPQRLFVRLETSENIHEDEKKFEKFFSRTQKYFTCPASCEGEWKYGLPGKHTMAGCFEMIGRFWKRFCVFRRQIQISFFGIGPLFEEPRLFALANGLVDSSTSTWQVQTVVYLSFLPVFDLVLSTIFLIIFSLYFICPCQQTCFSYR